MRNFRVFRFGLAGGAPPVKYQLAALDGKLALTLGHLLQVLGGKLHPDIFQSAAFAAQDMVMILQGVVVVVGASRYADAPQHAALGHGGQVAVHRGTADVGQPLDDLFVYLFGSGMVCQLFYCLQDRLFLNGIVNIFDF